MVVADSARRPLVVGLGGSTRATSLTDQLLKVALHEAEALGASTIAFGGAFLAQLPIYAQDDQPLNAAAAEFARTVASADGLIVATPGYHGGMSGLVKNGLDHLEALRDEAHPYLDGRAVGAIVTAAGWQACGTTLVSVRSAVHALRGWPTPYGVTVNSAEPVFAEGGALLDHIARALRLLAGQVVEFAVGSAPRRS